MDMYVYDEARVPIGITSRATAVQFETKYRERGTFSVTFPLDEQTVDFMQREHILVFDRASGIAGVIMKISQDTKSDGSEIVTVGGNLIEEYLYRRIVNPPINRTAQSVQIVSQMITQNLTAPTNTDRKMNGIVIGTPVNITDASIPFQNSYGVVGEQIEGICITQNYGYRMRFDVGSTNMVFTLYKGTDRTTRQSIVPPAVFSQDFENILTSKYAYNSMDYKTYGLIAGEGEGADRQLTSIGGGTGNNRREVYIDARDLQRENEDGTIMPLADYLKLLVLRGEERMSEMVEVENFSCDINTNGNLEFGVDYFLGDTVTLIDSRLGITVHAQLLALTHKYDQHDLTLSCTFGFEMAGIDKKLRRALR